jgi:uncharacterized membrane protein YhhN
MVFNNLSVLFGTVCLLSLAVHVVSEWRKWRVTRSVSKIIASASFVVLAVVNGAADTGYGRFILLALVFSAVGDALLLSLRSIFLLAGIAAFFFAHVLFTVAFVSQPLDTTWLIAALIFLAAAGLLFLSWMWRYLKSFYKIAVPVYLAAITLMTALAVAASSASGSPLLAIAAITFAASDVSVARDRFIAKDIVNKVWGLPLYYAAQILFAISVISLR